MKMQTAVFILALFTACAVEAVAAGGPRKGNGQRQGPPPEAYTACEGKSAGDTAEFTRPRGDAITGTCEQEGDKLVLRPDRPPQGNDGNNRGGRNAGRSGNGNSRQQGPPPEENNQGADQGGRNADSPRDGGGRQQGPPPEAYTACEGKSAGDTAEFTSPRGDTVTGTCEQQGDKLVLRPDHRPGGPGQNGRRAQK